MFATQVLQGIELNSTHWAGFHTDRLSSHGDASKTTITLAHYLFLSVVLRGTIRTGHLTITTANAYILIHRHQPIFPPFVHGTGGTGRNTGGFFTVITGNRDVIGKNIRIPPFVLSGPTPPFILINPSKIHTQWQIKKVLTGDPAGVATGTFVRIDKESVWVKV